MTNGQAIVFTGVNQVEYQAVTFPDPQEGEVLVRVTASAISPGTELRCLAGKQPNAVAFPFVPGYATVGIVEKNGPGTTAAPGTRVVCGGTKYCSVTPMWGGHASHAVVPEGSLIEVPVGIPSTSAALTKMTAIALRGVKLTSPKSGEKLLVIGLGLIGSLSARLFALHGADVRGHDLSADRLQRAKQFGITGILFNGSLVESVHALWPLGADIVVDATGRASALSESVHCARKKAWDSPTSVGSKLVIQGSYEGDFCLPYQAVFDREMTVLVPRDVEFKDQLEALELIGSGQCPSHDLVTLTALPSEASEVYASLQADPSQLTAIINWDD